MKIRRTNLEIVSDNTNIKYYYKNDNYSQPIVKISGLDYDVKCKNKKSAIDLMHAFSYKRACKSLNKKDENRKVNELSTNNYIKVAQ